MVASASRLKGRKSTSTQSLFGSTEPRIWTPPLRELTERTSLGFAAVEFASEVCGIDLFPWQRWLLIHMLELAGELECSEDAFGRLILPERDPMEPLFRFRQVFILVARQNGKSTLSQVLSLFFLYVLGVDLILGTAQDLDTAEEVWDGALDIIEDTPDLAALADKPIRVNGKKTIRLKTGERYKVKAANRRAGRGLSGDLIMLDELREHQSWDAWGAITKTTQARPAAMIVALSNAGDVSSVVLRNKRMVCHAALGDPDGINAQLSELLEPEPVAPDDGDDGDVEGLAPVVEPVVEVQTIGLFEWSAPPGCDVMDPVGWQWANPSMGHGISMQTIAGDASTEGRSPETEWLFRTEVLCQWADGAMRGPFAPGSWDATLRPVDEVRITSEKRHICVHVSYDRSRAYIAAAGEDAQGRTVVTVAAAALGVDWLRPWLEDNASQIAAVTGQGRGSWVSDLISSWRDDPTFRIPVVEWSGSDLTAAFGQAYDALRDKTVWHSEQPALDTAAAAGVKKDLAGGWVLDDRRSKCDVAPLVAWIGALWLHRRPAKAVAPRPSVARALPIEPSGSPSTPRRRRARDVQLSTADLATVSF